MPASVPFRPCIPDEYYGDSSKFFDSRKRANSDSNYNYRSRDAYGDGYTSSALWG